MTDPTDLVLRPEDRPLLVVPEEVWAEAQALMEAWIADKAELSQRNYRCDIEDFARWLGAQGDGELEDWTPAAAIGVLLRCPNAGAANRLVMAYKADLRSRPVWRSQRARVEGEPPDKHGLAPNTINRRLAALRSVLKLARVFGHIDWSVEVEGVKVTPYRDVTGIERDELRQLIDHLRAEAAEAAVDEDLPAQARALRDLAIVRFLADHALRRTEVLHLDYPDDVDLRHSRLRLLPKRDEEKHWFPMSAPSKAALKDWLELRGREPGPLFFGMSNRTSGERRRLSRRGFGELIEAAAHRAGIPHVRSHMFRHSAITRALDRTNGDVRAVQRFSRHAKIETVLVYDDRRTDKPRKIVDLVAGDDEDEDADEP
jgi:integrase/recombinase XerC